MAIARIAVERGLGLIGHGNHQHNKMGKAAHNELLPCEHRVCQKTLWDRLLAVTGAVAWQFLGMPEKLLSSE